MGRLVKAPAMLSQQGRPRQVRSTVRSRKGSAGRVAVRLVKFPYSGRAGKVENRASWI